MACIDCGNVVFEADTWQAMLVKMMPHYLEFIRCHRGETELPREEWMARFMSHRSAEARQSKAD